MITCAKSIVDVVCSDPRHPVMPWLERWAGEVGEIADVCIVQDLSGLRGGDFLFLISCHQIVSADVRRRYRFSLVCHAAALPEGRGWSPHIWQVLEGRNDLTVTLLNAEDGVDTGDIWQQRAIKLDGTELHYEINSQIFAAEVGLMSWALRNCTSATSRAQVGPATYYGRRKPEDSRIDPGQTITEVFDLLRVADPDRFPAFFDHRGQRFIIRIEKSG